MRRSLPTKNFLSLVKRVSLNHEGTPVSLWFAQVASLFCSFNLFFLSQSIKPFGIDNRRSSFQSVTFLFES